MTKTLFQPADSAKEIFLQAFIGAAKEAREFKQISQVEVARRMGTGQASICRFESGENKNPSLDFLFRLIETIDMRLDFRIVLKNGRKMLL